MAIFIRQTGKFQDGVTTHENPNLQTVIQTLPTAQTINGAANGDIGRHDTGESMNLEEREYCTCCGRTLTDEPVMLELDQRNDTYHDFGDIPLDCSQGWFPFGKTCAAKLRRQARGKVNQ